MSCVIDTANRLWLLALTVLCFLLPHSVHAQTMSLTLEQAINRALVKNVSVKLSENNLALQKYSTDQVDSQFETKIYPAGSIGLNDGNKAVSAGFSVQKSLRSGSVLSLTPALGRSDDLFSGRVDLELSIPLLRRFGEGVTLDGLYSSQAAFRSTQRTHELIQSSVVLLTIDTFYDILLKNKLVELLKQHVGIMNNHAIRAATKEKVGLAGSIDTFRANLGLKNAEEELAKMQEKLAVSHNQLKILLDLPLDDTVELNASGNLLSMPLNEDEAIATALRHRMEIKESEERITETVRKLDLSKKQLLPDINLVVSYSNFGESEYFVDSMSFNEHFWGVNLTTSGDFFKTAENLQIEKNRIAVNNAYINLHNQEQKIIKEVREEIQSLKTIKERLAIINEQIHQANGKRALSQLKFDHGLSDNSDIIEAEKELQTARVNSLEEKKNYTVSQYSYKAVLGTLLTDRPQ